MMPLLAVIVSIVGIEAFLRLPLLPLAWELYHYQVKVWRILNSPRISDHWKEKVMLRYAGQIGLLTLKLGVLMLAVLLVVVMISTGIDALSGQATRLMAYLASIEGTGIALLASLPYLWLRRRLVHG